MTLLLTTFTMLAFAGIYALVLAMISSRTPHLLAALLGREVRIQAVGDTGLAASRRFSRA